MSEPKKPMSNARIGGIVATVVLGVIFLFTFVFVWIS